MSTPKETAAKEAHAGRVAADEKWRFRVTVVRDVEVDGVVRHRKGDVFKPKGFYYNGHRDKWVVLVGDILSGHAVRQKVPRGSVEIEATFGGNDE